MQAQLAPPASCQFRTALEKLFSHLASHPAFWLAASVLPGLACSCRRGDRPSQSLRFQHQGSPSTAVNCFDFALGKDKGNKLVAQAGRMARKTKQSEEVRGRMR